MKAIWENGGTALYAEIIRSLEQKNYPAAQTETFLDKIYEGDARELISMLIQKDLITADEYEDLKKHWRGGDEER